MRYLVIFFWVIAVLVVGCEVSESPNTLHRSDSEIKFFEEKLLHLKEGDLLVMVRKEEGILPDMDKVVGPPQYGTIRVREVSYTGIHQQCTKCTREENLSLYRNHHLTRGAVHIIPAERVNVFYLHIGSEAFTLSQ